jgi:hypothetical protein
MQRQQLRERMNDPLEQRIAAALGDNDVTSTAIADLITQTHTAIAAAEAAVTAAKKDALDTSRPPDPMAARDAIAYAQFKHDWLKSASGKLQARQRQRTDQETYDDWVDTFETIKPRHTTAVANLAAVYQEFESKLVAALTEAKAVDAEVHRVMTKKPYLLPQTNGDGRNLPSVECAARGVNGVGPNGALSLMTELKLPRFSAPGWAWPPPAPVLTAEMVIPPAMLRHPGDNWAAHQNEAQAQADAEAKRVSDYYRNQTREREQRDNAQAKAAQERRRQAAT